LLAPPNDKRSRSPEDAENEPTHIENPRKLRNHIEYETI
jgi:hypothetical protein